MIIVLGIVLRANWLAQPTGKNAVYYKAVVQRVAMGAYQDEYGEHRGQQVGLQLKTGPDKDKTVQVFNPLVNNAEDFDTLLTPGDRVLVGITEEKGLTTYYVSDFDRTAFFYGLVFLFGASLIYFGRIIGLKALLGIAVALVILWRGFLVCLALPTINIFGVTLAFCLLVSFLVLIIISGFSLKSGAALIGTWGGLAVAGTLSYATIYLLHLSGINTEEAYMLKANILPFLDFHGVLFASMLIGALGAIIDVAVSIASAQWEMVRTSPTMEGQEIFRRGMNVGKDIMGAMSITLIFAYVGSSLPLLLVIAVDRQIPFEQVLNLPLIISELVRALVGSIGLIYAIPLTALVIPAFCQHKLFLEQLMAKISKR
jgi:uncharacterized membrane protein